MADEVQTPYSEEGVSLFEAFLKGRLQYLGYAVGEADTDLMLEVRVLQFDPGNRTARCSWALELAGPSSRMWPRFRDRSGALITQLEGGASYLGMEMARLPHRHLCQTGHRHQTGLDSRSRGRGGAVHQNNGELQSVRP